MWVQQDGKFPKLELSTSLVEVISQNRGPDDVPDARLAELLKIAEEEAPKGDPVNNLHKRFKREHRNFRSALHIVGRVNAKDLAKLRRSAKRGLGAYE